MIESEKAADEIEVKARKAEAESAAGAAAAAKVPFKTCADNGFSRGECWSLNMPSEVTDGQKFLA